MVGLDGFKVVVAHIVAGARLEARIKEAEAKKDERLVEQLLIEKQKLAVQRSKQKTAMLENN